ncbi:site-specific DNA-methyltransferase [Candidatus Poribacteria bacterium]|nr:site-specific DNA-methyltransferase [Candidatus Poribacteria bacterium]
MSFRIIQGDCEKLLEDGSLDEIDFYKDFDIAFLDPPFNQKKYYAEHNDNMPEAKYWQWMERILKNIYEQTSQGGAIYFMQREKNTERLLQALRLTNWQFQNLIVWRKMTSAIPSEIRFGKQYQVIAFATKGKGPRVFNRLRINPPLPVNYKHERNSGIYVTDIWDDIRELTSGYFAGEEPLRDEKGERFHKQQTPIQLLTRIILASSNPNDLVFDPFAGTGTTAVVSEQLHRNSISIELDHKNVQAIHKRMSEKRAIDDISRFLADYKYTENLNNIWPSYNWNRLFEVSSEQQMKLFDLK